MKILFNILAVLFSIIGVVGGVLLGLGSFVYGIYLIILLVKGTLAVTFWSVAQATLFVILAGLIGWAFGLVFLFLAGLCKAFAK